MIRIRQFTLPPLLTFISALEWDPSQAILNIRGHSTELKRSWDTVGNGKGVGGSANLTLIIVELRCVESFMQV
jgi:hypothetical protein